MSARIVAIAAVALTASGVLCVGAAEVEGLPAPAAPRAAKVLDAREKTLANGMRVIVVERPGLPLVSAQLLLRSGSESDPAQSAGLASFTAALLTRGTATRSATQIAREVEALGASLQSTAGWDGTTIDLATLSAHIDPAFALLADIARNPKFDPGEIERLRRQTLDELRVTFEEPRTLARLAASRALLGRGRYAHPTTGTPASIQRLRRPEIVAFHTTHYTARQAQLIIAGHVTADAAFALAEKTFGDWSGPEPTAPSPPAATPKSAAKPRAILIDMPTAGQAAVVLASPTIARTADDYFAGLVANAILGGGYTSRLNQEIRVKRGLSYGAASSLSALRDGGIFTARCQTKNASADEVVTVMRAELARLATEPAPADFFATRQAVLTGDFARDLETNEGYVERVADLATYGLPLDSIARYLDRIQSLGAEDARAFAARHLSANGMSIFIAGRARECAKPLRALLPTLEIIPQSELDLDSPSLRRPRPR